MPSQPSPYRLLRGVPSKQKRLPFLGILIVVIGIVVSFAFVSVNSIQAATYTWDGGGTDGTCGGNAGDGNKWSCAANWSTNIVPTSTDSVIFDATSTKNATIDASFAGSVASISINSGYTGTITQARSLTLSSTFSQSAGTFTGSSDTIDLNSGFTLGGGSFTSTSGTMTIAGSFNVTSGTFSANSGTVTLDGSTPSLTSCTGVTFNLVTFAHTSSATISSGCSAPMGNNPTIPATIVSNGGTITGTGTLTINKGTPIYTLNSTSGTASFSGFTTLAVNGTIQAGGGAINLSSFTTVTVLPTVATSALVMTSGSITAPSGTLTAQGGINFSGGTFTANGGTLVIETSNSGATVTCNSNTFNLVQFSGTSASGVSIGSACSLPLGSNPTIAHAGSFNVSGILSGSGTLTKTTGNFVHSASTAGLSGFTGFVLGGNFSTNSSVTANYGSLTLMDINGTFTTSSSSVFTAPSGTLAIASTASFATGTLTANGGTITFDGNGSASVLCNGNTFNLVTFAHTSPAVKTVNSTCTLPLGSNPTIPYIVSVSGTLNGSGILTFTKTVGNRLTFSSGASLTGFTGASFQDLTVNGATAVANFSAYNSFEALGTTTVSTSGTLTLPSGATVNDLALTSGTLNAPSGTLTISGNFTQTGATFTHNNGTVQLTGSGKTISGSNTFYNLTKTVLSNDTLTFTAGTTQTIAGSLTLQGQGSTLSLRSSAATTQWSIDPQGSRTISNVDVQDSNNINATAITPTGTNINSGNNTNWDFGTVGGSNVSPNLPSSLGPSDTVDGSTISGNQPTLRFTLSDSNGGDTLGYVIQIDNDSDFHSLQVEYASSLAAQGVQSFSVGQALQGGTYTNGHTGQTLEPGSYYWRVKTIDSTGAQSGYTTARDGLIAFVVAALPEATPPSFGAACSAVIAAPRIGEATSTSTSAITITFTPPPQTINSYALEYGTQSGVYTYAAASIGGASATSYTIRSLSPHTTYYIRVRAGYGCAVGAWSSEVSATTKGTVVASSQEDIASDQPPSSTGAGGSYIVQPGDTLWSIAQDQLGAGNRYGEIVDLNTGAYPSLAQSTVVNPGWELVLPGGSDEPEQIATPSATIPLASSQPQENSLAQGRDPQGLLSRIGEYAAISVKKMKMPHVHRASAVPLITMLAVPTLIAFALTAPTTSIFYPVSQLLSKLLQGLGLIPRRTPHGVVFDTVSGAAIPFVTVLIHRYGEEETLDSVVTDEQGVYRSIKLPPGKYRIEAAHSEYMFPTVKPRFALTSQFDFFKGEQFVITDENADQFFLIPMDPKPTQQQHVGNKAHLTPLIITRILNKIFYPFC